VSWLYPALHGKQWQNRRQKLKDKLLRTDETPNHYIEGIHYTTSMVEAAKHGTYIREFFLSTWCFADLCLRLNTLKSKALRCYHLALEEAHREFAGHAIAERREVEDPEISLYKQKTETYFDLPHVPMVYWSHHSQIDPITGEEIDIDKLGITKRGNTRLQENGLVIPGLQRLNKYYALPDATYEEAKAVEANMKRGGWKLLNIDDGSTTTEKRSAQLKCKQLV
jgi:hypothetical protein